MGGSLNMMCGMRFSACSCIFSDMTVENDMSVGGIPAFENADALLDLNLFYIRQIGASLKKVCSLIL